MNSINEPVPRPIIDLAAIYRDSNVAEVLDKLDAELIGLKPVKTRIREIAALLIIAKARASIGLQANAPSMHRSFTGNPGTGSMGEPLSQADLMTIEAEAPAISPRSFRKKWTKFIRSPTTIF